MFILLALIFAAVAGVVLHFVLPGRATRGTALAPFVSVAVTAALYTALTWIGLGEGNVWLWVIALLVPVVLTAGTIVVLARTREAHDAREAARLRIA